MTGKVSSTPSRPNGIIRLAPDRSESAPASRLDAHVEEQGAGDDRGAASLAKPDVLTRNFCM